MMLWSMLTLNGRSPTVRVIMNETYITSISFSSKPDAEILSFDGPNSASIMRSFCNYFD